jgi:hypothetical protein
VKNTSLALTIVATLLFCFIAPALLVNLSKANPMGLIPKELKPILVTIQSPKDDGRILRDEFSLIFSVRNPPLGGASSISYRIQGFSEVAVNPASYISSESGAFYTEYSNYTYSVTVSAAGLPDGLHSLAVVVSGKALYSPDQTGVGGVEAEISGSDSIRFLFDVVPPNVSVLSPINVTYTEPDLPLNFTLSEEAKWIGYSLDEQPPVTVLGNTTLAGLSAGMHSLTVYANDTVGRKGSSETVFFSMEQETDKVVTDQREPFPSAIIGTASAVSVAAVGLGLLAYSNKRKREAGHA